MGGRTTAEAAIGQRDRCDVGGAVRHPDDHQGMATGWLDNAPVEVACPGCRKKLKTTVGKARRSPRLRCSCGDTAAIDVRQFDRTAAAVARRLKNLTFR